MPGNDRSQTGSPLDQLPTVLPFGLLDEPLIALMRKSGCYHITIAVESASDRVLRDLINKPVNLTHVPRVVRACRKAGMGISAFFVVGFPGETKKEIAQTFDYAMSMGADTRQTSLPPHPIPEQGCTESVQRGQLMPSPVDFASLRIGQPIITTPDWTAQEVGRHGAGGTGSLLSPYGPETSKPIFAGQWSRRSCESREACRADLSTLDPR